MSDETGVPVEKPVIRRGYGGLFSIWLVPVIAILVAGWLIFQNISEKGPEIRIFLPSAKGMEAGKTPLKYRDVVIGVLDRIEFPDDDNGVNLIVEINSSAEKYLTDTARFWVVAPAIGFEGVSGLETLLSGAYLEIDPGTGGKEKRDFVGLETPPVITSRTAGTEFTLLTPRLGTVKRGTPILYRGLVVGKILGYSLSGDKQAVELYAFVEKPFDALVHEATLFWNAGGVSVTLSPAGLEVGAESLQALIAGAVEFETPPFLTDTFRASENHQFQLHSNRSAMENARFTERVSYILYFDGSVSGLSVGADVEFKGMKVGTVKDIKLQINPDTGQYFLPVVIEIEPQRVQIAGEETRIDSVVEAGQRRARIISALIEKGLKARLKTANFLTGQLIVDLDLLPERPAQYVAEQSDMQEIPTVPAGMDEITTSLARLVEKIERLPVERVSKAVLNTAEGLERIVNSPDFAGSVTEIRETARSVRRLVDNIDRETLPAIGGAFEDTRKALQRADQTLQSAEQLFDNTNGMLADGSPLKYDLTVMMRELAAASRAVRNLADFLERNPSSLLGGKK
ncbi:PqiB family protein [Sneathiella chinensis]|uniref:Membrane protein n=1 Tax=Sneathiella chinensis TaxID=349750 RepID=A0ABQ5U3E9_9PROT|nr:MlaD family protein [Sneathiella chinensis]GLQ06592.1 membrane protein [Sneathiella chinensis]